MIPELPIYGIIRMATDLFLAILISDSHSLEEMLGPVGVEIIAEHT